MIAALWLLTVGALAASGCGPELDPATYLPQLRTWITSRARAVYPGGVDLDSWTHAPQILIREEGRPTPDLVVVADDLSWDPVRGLAPTGDFRLLVPRDRPHTAVLVRAVGRTLDFAVRVGRDRDQWTVRVSPGAAPDQRVIRTLRLMRELRRRLTAGS